MPETQPAFDNIETCSARHSAGDAETAPGPDRRLGHSENASLIDYSPLLIGAIPALSSNSLQAPSSLALLCRNGRNSPCRRRALARFAYERGRIHVANERGANAFTLAAGSEGKSVSGRCCSGAGIIRANTIHLDIRCGGIAQFDLSGLGVVQAKLTGSCRWPLPKRGRCGTEQRACP